MKKEEILNLKYNQILVYNNNPIKTIVKFICYRPDVNKIVFVPIEDKYSISQANIDYFNLATELNIKTHFYKKISKYNKDILDYKYKFNQIKSIKFMGIYLEIIRIKKDLKINENELFQRRLANKITNKTLDVNKILELNRIIQSQRDSKIYFKHMLNDLKNKRKSINRLIKKNKRNIQEAKTIIKKILKNDIYIKEIVKK